MTEQANKTEKGPGLNSQGVDQFGVDPRRGPVVRGQPDPGSPFARIGMMSFTSRRRRRGGSWQMVTAGRTYY